MNDVEIGYYYCSINTFLNIIKNREIYLSDPLKMNDSSEIKWYLNKLNEEQENRTNSIFDEMKKRSGLEFSFKELSDTLDLYGQNSIYISCFSEEPDLLSQWRAYADDGRGVAIGFILENLVEYDNFLLEKIIYPNEVVYDSLENDVEVVSDQIGTVISEGKITSNDEMIRLFIHELVPVLAKYKNPAFQEEKELRLIYCDDLKFDKIVDKYNAFQRKLRFNNLEHHFRVVNNYITEFVKFPFVPSTIRDIYIGPKCHLTINDIKRIADRYLHKSVNVYVSESSYR